MWILPSSAHRDQARLLLTQQHAPERADSNEIQQLTVIVEFNGHISIIFLAI